MTSAVTSSSSSSSSSQINPTAQNGFSKAAQYDQHRPSFPAHSVSILLDGVRVANKPQATVVDLAAGTGKFTELLAARDEGYEIIAVEPHADMRKVLEEKRLERVSVRDGLSTDMKSLEDESVDAVIAAQAFHWFANVESLREINRVLQPHGAFGMIWNVEDYNAPKSHTASTPWEQRLQTLMHTFHDTQPRFRDSQWRTVFDEAQLAGNPLTAAFTSTPLFSLPLAEETESWSVWLSEERLWQRFSTLSHIAVLEGEELKRVKGIFDDAVKEVRRNEKAEIEVHGMTVCVWTTKIPQEGVSSLLSTVKDALAGRT